ncbi:MAG: NUMOD4 domain-containing protein [Bacilli bacterium]|nr:NUMOD4 domain-containing protein [Bacilli bacterium]
MNEIWKDIPNYEKIYQVSNFGRVRTHKNKVTHTERFNKRRWKQRILKDKGANVRTGYRITLWKDGKPKDYLVARLVATTFLDNLIETKMTVNHIDGNRFNNKITNLEWCSRKENISKAFENGLYKQDAVIIQSLKTKKIKQFRSKAEASRFLNRNVAYVSAKSFDIEKNISSKSGEEFKIIKIIKANQKQGTSLERLSNEN